ncbi:MAG: GAF domain-containing protein, partial [Anaerolineales bacterium]|nr:GAF domain-containing protein [Anaerolineales bacterium]
MRHSSENDLNALSAWILGITGTSLLLIPFHFNMTATGIPGWALSSLGIFCGMVAISNQVLFALKSSRKRTLFYRSASVFLLFILGLVFIRAGYFIEGFVFGFVGIMQLALIIPLKNKFLQTDPLNLTFILIGFSSGIYLAMSGNQYAQVDITSYKAILAILFLVTSSFEVFRKVIPSKKIAAFFPRIQIIPWLGWFFVFIPTLSAARLIAPAMLLPMMVLSGFIPWNQLRLPDNDILGTRAVKIGSTLERTLLIFLSALLAVMDPSLKAGSAELVTARNAAFIFFALSSAILYYEIATIVMTINGLMNELTLTDEEAEPASDLNPVLWNSRLARYIKPFMSTGEGLRIRLNMQTDQIRILAHQVANEKKRNTQIALLMELSQQLENQLDQPVAAQLAVITLERALNCDLSCLFTHESDDKEFMLLAAAGKQTNMIPSGFRQSVSKGVLGRALRQRKTQIINDIGADADYIRFENEPNLSAVVIPLIFNGYVNGAIMLNSETPSAFSSIDIWLAEAVAAELTRAWERSRYHQRLMNLVQTGSQLSTMVKPETTAHEVASIAREILQARFTFVKIQLGQERNFIQIASSGDAPRLQESLGNSNGSEALIHLAF